MKKVNIVRTELLEVVRYTDYDSSLNHRNIVAGHLRSIKS